MKTVIKLSPAIIALAVLLQAVQSFGQESNLWIPEWGNGAWMGISISDLTKSKATELKLSDENGVVVDRVEKDSPAEKAGLQANDVIIQFNDEKVFTVRQFTRMVHELLPNRIVRLEIIRNGLKKNFSVTLVERPKGLSRAPFDVGRIQIPPLDLSPLRKNLDELRENFRAWKGPDEVFALDLFESSHGRLGVSLESLTSQLGDYFGVKDGHGALIVSVRKDSPADKAGLKAGDVIVNIDSKDVTSPSDVIRIVRSKAEGTLEITILRDRQTKTIQARLEKPEQRGEPFRERVRTLRLRASRPTSVV